MSKIRTWYVATVAPKLVHVGPESHDSQTTKTRVGTVEAINRDEATDLAAVKWPGKTLEITRGSQG